MSFFNNKKERGTLRRNDEVQKEKTRAIPSTFTRNIYIWYLQHSNHLHIEYRNNNNSYTRNLFNTKFLCLIYSKIVLAIQFVITIDLCF